MCQKLSVLPAEWINPLKELASKRHAFVHFKDAEHKNSLGARVMLEKSAPVELLQKDAELAIEYMFKVFRATLQEAF